MAARLHDIAIVGGGIAGLSLASSIAHSPWTQHLSVALIEANPYAAFKNRGVMSNRTSSLTSTSVRYLQRSTAWEHMALDRTQKYRNMHVYDGLSDQQIEFEQSSEIATMVENANLQAALLQSQKDKDVTHVFAKVETIEKPTLEDVFPRVQLSNGTAVRARLIVGADGANSPVRQYAGITSRGWDYPHHGVVGTLTHETHDHPIAHQRMLPCGPIAFLPFPGDQASMVWSIHPRYAAKIKALDMATVSKFANAAFRLSWVDLKYILNLPSAEIAAELDWRLSLPSHSKHAPPRILNVEQVASFPLKFRHAETYHADRAVLIGDAAHTIHPLAGQGLNLALADSASLQMALERCIELGGDVGYVGEEVTRDRYWANARVAGVVDKIHKLYAREERSIVGLRSLGSGILDKIEVAKRAVMASVG